MRNRRIVAWLFVSTFSLPGLAADYAGRVEWTQKVALTTLASGEVAQIDVDVGQQVKKGELLLRLDPGPFDARISKAQAQVSATRVADEEAKRESKRTQEMFDRTLISVHQLEVVKIEATKTAARYQAALAELKLAQIDKTNSEIRAPFAGVILERKVSPGAIIVSRTEVVPVLVLAAIDWMSVRSAVPSAVARGLTLGQEAAVRVGTQEFKGKVRRLGFEPLSKTANPEYLLEVDFQPSQPLNLRVGDSATISLP